RQIGGRCALLEGARTAVGQFHLDHWSTFRAVALRRCVRAVFEDGYCPSCRANVGPASLWEGDLPARRTPRVSRAGSIAPRRIPPAEIQNVSRQRPPENRPLSASLPHSSPCFPPPSLSAVSLRRLSPPSLSAVSLRRLSPPSLSAVSLRRLSPLCFSPRFLPTVPSPRSFSAGFFLRQFFSPRCSPLGGRSRGASLSGAGRACAAAYGGA